MAINRKKTVHVHSSVPNKQPLASVLEVGELAVNNAAGNEFISTKNTDDEVVRFSSDNKMVSIIEKKTVMPYKGEVLEPTEQDLLDNKSQIVIGLNQVAASDTTGYDQVNGATDMHGNEINPSEDGGKTNGAGFAINMDKYAMIGANPSFSSVTVSDIMSDEELFIGNNKELEDGVQMPEISVYGSSVKIHANDGKVGITSKDDINISGEHDGNFNVENNMCIGAGNEMKIGAVEKLTIGEDCSGTETGVVEIKGGEVVIKREPTNSLSATTVEGALEELADKVTAAGDGYITGGHVDSGTGIINVDVLEHPSGATIDGLEEYINNRLGDISGIAKRSEVTKETIDEVPKIVISFFDKDDNELEDLEIVLDDYYNKGEIDDMELVIAAALNDLNDRLLIVSGDVTNLKIDVEELKNRKDNFVTDGEVNSGSGIIYLNMSESDEPAEVTGLAEFVESKVAGLSGDTFVDGGSVNSGTGVINLVKNDGTSVPPITGLAEYVESKLGSVSADTFVTGGSVDSGTGVINLVKNDGTPVQPISGLSQYVSGKTDGLFKEVTYVESSHTYVFKDSDGDEVGSLPAIATVSEVTTDASGSTWIKFKDENGNEISGLTINANEFVKDGMVSNAEVKDITSGESTVKCLVITFNTDAGHDDIKIPISDIFDPGWFDNYYTKQEINNALGEWFHPSAITSSVTDVISGMQLTVAAALNDLNTRVIDVSGDVIDLGDRVTTLEENSIVSGSVSGTILYLDKENGQKIEISGLPTPGSTEYDGVVTGGSVNGSGTIILNRRKGDGSAMTDVPVSGLPTYVDSRLVGKYLPLSGGTVSGNTTFTSDLVASGSNGITATKFVKNGGTNTQVLMADGSVKELGTITGDNFVTGGSVDNQGVIHLANTDTSRNDTITGLSGFVSSMLDGNDYVVSGSVNTDSGVIALTNTDPAKNGEIVGLSDYVSSVTQNFITAAQDKYVSAGTVGNDGVITLNLRHGGTASVTGLETYINDKLDGNDYVTGGEVDQTSGDIDLTYNTSRTGQITGLAQYVAEHSAIGDWVDVSGDTMTGPLVIDPSGNGVTYALEVDGDVSVSGDVTATGAMYSSDKRLKENIEVVSAEDLENVKNVEFKSFNFISNKESKKVGVIAQELQDNGLGKLTATNEAGYLTVDYISLLCLKIAELEKEIKELKNKKS